MTTWRALLAALCLALLPFPSLAAPQPRPFTGSGMLLIRPFPPELPAGLVPIVLYREPGVGRIAELTANQLPSLDTVRGPVGGARPVAVMGKKGNWLRIAYDDAGREGWVEAARRWEYLPWDAFLPGRSARFLPGLKKGEYVLRASPIETAPQLPPLTGGESLRLIEVQDDWALAAVDTGLRGWLRWRDRDGRFRITVGEKPTPQKD